MSSPPPLALALEAAGAADLPEPARRLQEGFRWIRDTRMQGIPLLNPALEVEAIGFHRWSERWLGVLVTPWFMSLVLMPDLAADEPFDREVPTRRGWYHVPFGKSIRFDLPAGRFGFIGAFETRIGEYQTCSLFSPVFEFRDHATARATALAALAAAFDPAHRLATDRAAGTPMPAAAAAARATTTGAECPTADAASADGPAVAQPVGPATAPAPTTAAPSRRDFLRGRWQPPSPGSDPSSPA